MVAFRLTVAWGGKTPAFWPGYAGDSRPAFRCRSKLDGRPHRRQLTRTHRFSVADGAALPLLART